MKLFGRKEEKIEDFLEKYGLKIEEYDSEKLKQFNVENLKRIKDELVGLGLIKTGLALSFSKPAERAQLGYLAALIEQNWIQIRQNEIIINELKKINKN